MRENIVADKAFAFGVRVMKLRQYLVREHHEFEVSKQLVRSGTSIGANIEEAVGGISRADFVHKISIAYKEARESSYWLRLLQAADYLSPRAFDSLWNDSEELCRLLRSILNTAKGLNQEAKKVVKQDQ